MRLSYLQRWRLRGGWQLRVVNQSNPRWSGMGNQAWSAMGWLIPLSYLWAHADNCLSAHKNLSFSSLYPFYAKTIDGTKTWTWITRLISAHPIHCGSLSASRNLSLRTRAGPHTGTKLGRMPSRDCSSCGKSRSNISQMLLVVFYSTLPLFSLSCVCPNRTGPLQTVTNNNNNVYIKVRSRLSVSAAKYCRSCGV